MEPTGSWSKSSSFMCFLAASSLSLRHSSGAYLARDLGSTSRLFSASHTCEKV